MTKTMMAAVLDAFGSAEQLVLRSMPIPEIGPHDVLIRVEAAGIASWDAVEREGKYDGVFGFTSKFPYVLGWDGAGIVSAVGNEVSRFQEGDRVYAATIPKPRGGGFYAEYAVVAADFVAPVPDRLTTLEAAVMPWDAVTALSGLDRLNLKPNSTLMIFGASGGIGHMAIQFAKRMGARVLAIASGDDGVALARDLGADKAVDGRKDNVITAANAFAPNGLDAALITVGGEKTDRAMTAVKEGGRIACPYGVIPPLNTPRHVDLSLYNGDRSENGSTRLNSLIESGPFEVHIDRTFTLDQIVDAHRALGNHYVGKLALRFAE